MRTAHLTIAIVAFLAASALGFGQEPAKAPAPSGSAPKAAPGGDGASTGCEAARAGVTKSDVLALLKSGISSATIQDIVKDRGHGNFSSQDLADFKQAQATDALLADLAADPDMYIGWSVLPSNVVRDNYGKYVMNKFFGLDIAVSNRSTQSVVIAALEFCHDELRDVSADPTLVRGSLQEGQLTGARTLVSDTIQGVGSVVSPLAPFFKVVAHRATFSTGAALFSPLQSAFDLIVPDTTATYLSNWDKDQVFKSGFVVTAGGSQRGRVFIPIEYIYPKPMNGQGSAQASQDWHNATSGRYNSEVVKRAIGSLIMLGQEFQFGARRALRGAQ